MGPKTAVSVKPNDLARVVDALCNCSPGAQGIVDGEVVGAKNGMGVVEEAVLVAGVIYIVPDDLARVVDGRGERAFEGVCRRIVEGSVKAAVQEEAVVAAAVGVIPNDLARLVDAPCNRFHGSSRIVEGNVGATA